MNERTPDAWRSLFAEVRATEDGHQARWDDTLGCFTVLSESEPGVHREVRVGGLAMTDRRVYMTFQCSCPFGLRGRKGTYGLTECRHAARVAQRLEREGLAEWRKENQRWIAKGSIRDAALADAFDSSGDPATGVSAPGKSTTQRFTEAEREAQLRANL